ncbi:MAG: hypothetical protein AB7T22_10280 [Calditrichaceae bacterium]
MPKRRETLVELKKSTTGDNTGVVGCILSDITGATTDYGFGEFRVANFDRSTAYYGTL